MEKFDSPLNDLKNYDYLNTEKFKRLYDVSHDLHKVNLILQLGDKLDYVSSLEAKEKSIKKTLIKDLIECNNCGLSPNEEGRKCFKCIMKNIGGDTVKEMESLANYHFLNNNFEYSIELLNHILEFTQYLDIDKSTYYDSIGKAYEKLGDLENVITTYKQAIENFPKQSKNHHVYQSSLNERISKLYYGLKKFEQSLFFINKIEGMNSETIIKLKLKTLIKLKDFKHAYLLIEDIPSFLLKDKTINKLQKKIIESLTPEELDKLKKFHNLIQKGESVLNSEKLDEALEIFQDALYLANEMELKGHIYKLTAKISKIKHLNNKLTSDVLLEPEINTSPGTLKQKVLKKGFSKKLSKTIGKVSKNIVGDKISELTGNENIGKIAGKIAQKGISKIAEQGLVDPSTIMSTKKKRFKGLSKSLGKLAGNIAGDKISELTGNENIGKIAGKIAEKGVSKMAEKGTIQALKTIESSELQNVQSSKVIQNTREPISINLKERLLVILKAKKIVKIDYVEKFLKIHQEEIIGMIFDLIGKGQIEGEFNEDDSEFKLKEQS